MTADQKVRIELTAEQVEQVKEASGQELRAIEFTVEELEDRIAPTSFLASKCAQGSHFPTVIITA